MTRVQEESERGGVELELGSGLLGELVSEGEEQQGLDLGMARTIGDLEVDGSLHAIERSLEERVDPRQHVYRQHLVTEQSLRHEGSLHLPTLHWHSRFLRHAG